MDKSNRTRTPSAGSGIIAVGSSAPPQAVGESRRHGGAEYDVLAAGDLLPADVAQSVASPEAPFYSPPAIVVKRGRSALVVRTAFHSHAGPVLSAYKRLGSRNGLQRLLRSFLPDRAVKNFHFGRAMIDAGVATPRPLLAVWPRRRVLLRPSYLATEWVDGAVPIDAFLRAASGEPAARRRRLVHQTAVSVGRLVGRLHAAGFAHRDLKAANLLVRESCGNVEVFLIDLDGASRPRWMSQSRRLSNLARLAMATHPLPGVSHAVKRRALAAYLESLASSGDWKVIWSELRELTRIRLLRKRRSERR